MHQELNYNPFNPIPTEENANEIESKYERLFDMESSYLAASGYSRNRDAMLFRERAVLIISKYAQCDNFPLIPYLATYYFDRYMSKKNPVLDYPRYKQHEIDVIAITCLILAWKMQNLNFTTTKFLVERPDLTEITAEQLVNMEIRIVKELDWYMRPITAFCFVPYFCQKLESKYGFRPRTICEIIVHAQDGIWITELRPSVIALSAFLAASDYLYPGEIFKFYTQILFERNFLEVQRDIDACTEHMIRLCHDLNLMVESARPENRPTVTYRVQAGRNYKRSSHRGETSISAPAFRYRTLPISRAAKGKEKIWEILESEDVDVEKYHMTEIPRMAEDSEEMQFSFRLRWRVKDTDLSAMHEFLAEIEAKQEAEAKTKAEAEAESERDTETDSDLVESHSNRSDNKDGHCRCSIL